MPDIRELTLEEAKRQLKMNLSLIEMLKGNTPPLGNCVVQEGVA